MGGGRRGEEGGGRRERRGERKRERRGERRGERRRGVDERRGGTLHTCTHT